MLHSLPLFHRLAGQPVIVLGEGEAAEAKRRLLERAGALVVGADDQQARLAFVALDEPEAAAAGAPQRVGPGRPGWPTSPHPQCRTPGVTSSPPVASC